jgi:hypothetical protein
VAIQAYGTGQQVLRMYSHRHSPHIYSQPQLFACLVLKTFFKVDYRGLVALLREHSDLRCALDLKRTPHFTTLQKASKRLLRVPVAQRLFANTVKRFLGRRERLKRVAFDSTGLECGHRSIYYIRRRNGTLKRWQTVGYSRYAKLEAAMECSSHLLVAALVGRGPRVDVDRFVPLLDAALTNVCLDSVLADAGYDSEANHQHARDRHRIRSYIPATAGRPTTKLPSGRYRRQMKQRLNKYYGHYGQRWQVETGFSMLKRRIATAVNGRSYWSQCREVLLLAITYNLMLLYAAGGFLQSRSKGVCGKTWDTSKVILHSQFFVLHSSFVWLLPHPCS